MHDLIDSTAGENAGGKCTLAKENKRQDRLGGVSKLGSNWVGNQSDSLCTAATGHQSDCRKQMSFQVQVCFNSCCFISMKTVAVLYKS